MYRQLDQQLPIEGLRPFPHIAIDQDVMCLSQKLLYISELHILRSCQYQFVMRSLKLRVMADFRLGELAFVVISLIP